MSEPKSLTDFFAAWGNPDADGRAALVASAIGKTFYYADPQVPAPITSAESFLGFVEMFLTHSPPGARAEVVAPVDVHHGHARATVRFVMGPDKAFAGQYFADLDADGKITRLIGFPGKGPE